MLQAVAKRDLQGPRNGDICKYGRMPFNRRECADSSSPTYEAMRSWLNRHQSIELYKQRSPKKFWRLNPQSHLIRDFLSPGNMPDYTLDNLRHGYIRTFIPKELITLLDRYAVDPNKYTGPRQTRSNAVDAGEDALLSHYMHSVMESNNLNNMIYNINFYTTRDNDYWNMKSDVTYNYLDPFELAHIFELMRKTIKLMPNQLQYLRKALNEMARLSADDLDNFLYMFRRNGLLVPRVLALLRGVVNTMAMELGMKKLLLFAFRYARQAPEVWLAMDGGGTIKLAEPLTYSAEVEEIIEGLDWEGYDRDGYDKYGYNRYGYDKQGFIRPHDPEPEIVVPELGRDVLRAYKKRVDTFLERMRYIQMEGKKGDGYYEPWDAKARWSTALALVDKAKSWRINRLDLSKYHFKRGFEKYFAELEHTSEMLGLMDQDLRNRRHSRFHHSLGSFVAHRSNVFKRNRNAILTLGKSKRRRHSTP